MSVRFVLVCTTFSS